MEQTIRKFWLWFEKNDALIRRVLRDGDETKKQELANHFDRKILEFGHFSWEITKGEWKEYAFVISPNRDPELFKISQNIVSQAPKMDDWEFWPAKLANPAPESFKLYDEQLDTVWIDPAQWSIQLDGNTVNIWAPELAEVDTETRDHAMDLVVTAIYGEAYRIQEIVQIHFVAQD